jgi:hypothetical protein
MTPPCSYSATTGGGSAPWRFNLRRAENMAAAVASILGAKPSKPGCEPLSFDPMKTDSMPPRMQEVSCQKLTPCEGRGRVRFFY